MPRELFFIVTFSLCKVSQPPTAVSCDTGFMSINIQSGLKLSSGCSEFYNPKFILSLLSSCSLSLSLSLSLQIIVSFRAGWKREIRVQRQHTHTHTHTLSHTHTQQKHEIKVHVTESSKYFLYGP